MVYFLAAIGFGVLAALGIAIGLRKFARKLRTRLSLLFVGFLLIPIVPLGFITVSLLTRNVDIWANSRIEKALEDSFVISTKLRESETGIDSETESKIRNVTSVLQSIKQLQMLKSPVKTVLWVVFFGGVFALVLAGIAAARTVSRKIERPILNLVQGTAEIARGDFGHQIPGEGEDEMGNLVKSFNRMSIDLDTQREAVKDMEHLRAWQEIARRVSHEIRNPLTSIGISVDRLSRGMGERDRESMYNEQLATGNSQRKKQTKMEIGKKRDGDRDRDRDRECLSTIREGMANLKQLASEFSEFGRLPELKPELCNLNEIVENAIGLCAEKQDVKANYRENLPDIMMDKNSMTRVLVNLIKNGMDAGGDVTVSTSTDKEWAVVSVSDTGSGIPEQDLSRVFEPYVTTKSTGTGLGLAIAKKIVLDHGGQLDIDSEEGKGTRVTVRLPLQQV